MGAPKDDIRHYGPFWDIAEKYAMAGIPVFPVNKNKSPCVKNGFKEATCDQRTIKKWAREYNDALCATPNTTFYVIDVDDHKIDDPMIRDAHDHCMKDLFDSKVITEKCMKVKTMSGGTHYYFRRRENSKKGDMRVTRSINVMPQIDLLADGGYTVLPDQKHYIAEIEEEGVMPWEIVKKSPFFKKDAFARVVDRNEILTCLVKDKTRRNRQNNKAAEANMAKDKNEAKTFNENTQHPSDEIVSNYAATNKKAGGVAHVDYTADSIVFKEIETIYSREESKYQYDYDEKLMGVGARNRIKLDIGSVDSEMIGKLFYNRQIQMQMCKFLGLKRTYPHQTTLNRSILPGHTDKKDSMGVRWNNKGSHIVVRDFANYYVSMKQNHDYNLVRLFACQRYKTNIYRLSPAEFVIWFFRLLYEANIIDIDHVFKEFGRDIESLPKSEQKMATSMLLLDALKSLHKNYEGETTFADKFSSAWARMSVSTVGRVKKELLKKGYISNPGIYNCAPDRKDNFFATPLYSIETEKVILVGNDREHEDTVILRDMRKSGTMNKLAKYNDMMEAKKSSGTNVNLDPQQSEEAYEDEMEKAFPNVGTLFRIDAAQDTYNTLSNFCADFEIPNMVDMTNMFSPIFYSEDFIADVIKDTDKLIVGEDLRLVMEDKPTEKGFRPLILTAESEAFNTLWEEIHEKHGEHNHSEFTKPSLNLVLSYDVEDLALDLEILSVRLNEYFRGEVKFQGVYTDHLTHDQIDHKLDGIYQEDGGTEG